MVSLATFQDYYDQGFVAIPVVFNDKKEPVSFPKHGLESYNMGDLEKWIHVNGHPNAIALKMRPPFGMFDFDLKNTDNKAVYIDWFNAIESERPEILRKVCIESTKSNGFHCYIKYAKLDHKIPVARSEKGLEVISVYTGDLLSFCYPSPGYKIFHNDFDDLEDLTDDEFEYLVKLGSAFNEYELDSGQSKVQVIEYPVEYENVCLQFDNHIDDDTFETLLNAIGLIRLRDYRVPRGKKWVAFLREGSTGSYSAKVYFHSKRLLIFSASMSQYPTWHDSARAGDNRWSLSPSKILYYKNNRDWSATMQELHMIADSASIEIVTPEPLPVIPEDRLRFPYDVFPEEIQLYISNQRIQHEYLAGAILGAISVCLGNSVTLEAMPGYIVKPILYMALVAPPGASKSPALVKAFSILERYDTEEYKGYREKLTAYKQELAAYEKNKNASEKPEHPHFPQMLIKDSTIEMVIKILSHNPVGCCLLADELAGFLNRMNQYKTGDEVQKWLEMWSGSPVLLQRVSREENKVEKPFCTIIGGIQPGVLDSLSRAENEHNGFFHRFLFVYPQPDRKRDWLQVSIPDSVRIPYESIFLDLLEARMQDPIQYTLSRGANDLYTAWFNTKNRKYNVATSDHIKGIIAKYQDYCLRFALILQALYDRSFRLKIIAPENMERAIRLTEYFFGNMHKATSILTPETPTDRLQPPWNTVYASLPACFSVKTAITIAKGFNVKESAFKAFLYRNEKTLFQKGEDKGTYEKIY